MELNFSALMNTNEAMQKEAEKGQNQPIEPIFNCDNIELPIYKENPAEKEIEAQRASNMLQRQADINKAMLERSAEAYKEYQEGIKKTEDLQIQILKGIKAGEDTTSLFLKAAKALSLCIGNEYFYEQIETDLTAIYGKGFREPAVLNAEIEKVKERKARLETALAAEDKETDRLRLISAIKAHEEKLAGLLGQ